MDNTRRERILAAARNLGPEAFNRLVASVETSTCKGRLRFWQEELLARLSDVGSISFAEFINAFVGAVAMPVRWDEADAPTTTFVTAWRTNKVWRDDFLTSAVREVSKHGSLESYAHVYRELASSFTVDEHALDR